MSDTNSAGAQIGGQGYVICRRCKSEATDISVETSPGYAFHVACRPSKLPVDDKWVPAASSSPQYNVAIQGGVMTASDVAKILGHKYTSRVYDLIKKGILDAKQVDGVVSISEASVKAYQEKRDARASGVKEKTPKRAVRAVPKPSKRAKQAEAAK